MAWLFLIVVVALVAFFKLDSYLHVRVHRGELFRPSKYEKWNFVKSYLKRRINRHIKNLWSRCKLYAKKVWNWCKRLWAFFKKNTATALLYIAGGLIVAALASFGSDIYELYGELHKQIDAGGKSPEEYRGIAIRYFGIVAGAGAVIGYIIAIARNITADKQNKINEQGQITESMVHAIAQIGAFNRDKPNIEVRLGGLYSLQRIMQDGQRDEETIAKIFYAYVRENAKKDETNPPELREDVQTALDIIGQFNRGWEDIGKEIPLSSRINFARVNFLGYSISKINFRDSILEDIDLSGLVLKDMIFSNANLTHANLSDANLSGANLDHANLSDANLSRVNLENTSLLDVNLSDANLSRASLHQVDLEGANLINANLFDANLFSANLSDSNLSGANLSDADLSDANLIDANLSRANLSGANLSGAELESAKLSDANLSNTNLEGANLEYSNLEGANLSGANLDGTNLEEANLKNASLVGADLSESDRLQQEQIDEAKGDKKTKLPEDITRPESWEEEENNEIPF